LEEKEEEEEIKGELVLLTIKKNDLNLFFQFVIHSLIYNLKIVYL
jgi:hypothetical protein